MANTMEGGAELSSPDRVRNLVLKSTLGDVVKLPSSPLVAFNAQDDLHSCYVSLVKNGIHSAPVFEVVPGGTKSSSSSSSSSSSREKDGGRTEKRWVGMLDWHGFVHYVIQFIRSDEVPPRSSSTCGGDS